MAAKFEADVPLAPSETVPAFSKVVFQRSTKTNRPMA